jgi:hypothetical protein
MTIADNVTDYVRARRHAIVLWYFWDHASIRSHIWSTLRRNSARADYCLSCVGQPDWGRHWPALPKSSTQTASSSSGVVDMIACWAKPQPTAGAVGSYDATHQRARLSKSLGDVPVTIPRCSHIFVGDVPATAIVTNVKGEIGASEDYTPQVVDAIRKGSDACWRICSGDSTCCIAQH